MQTVFTQGINEKVATDTSFAKAVTSGLARFIRRDWGDVDDFDRNRNEENRDSLDSGGYGMILASYGTGQDKFWIIRNLEATTVLFPSEY